MNKLNLELYIITMHAVKNTDIVIYNHYAVAHSLEEATKNIMDHMKLADIEVYNKGMELGGWNKAHHTTLNLERIKGMFKELEPVKGMSHKNILMQRIVETKDVELLHANHDKLEEHDIKFLHKKITEM